MIRVTLGTVLCYAVGAMSAAGADLGVRQDGRPPMTSNHATGLQTPTFSSEGRIICGAKSIWKKEGYAQLFAYIDDDAICTLSEVFNLGQSDIGPVFFLNKKDRVKGRSSV